MIGPSAVRGQTKYLSKVHEGRRERKTFFVSEGEKVILRKISN